MVSGSDNAASGKAASGKAVVHKVDLVASDMKSAVLIKNMYPLYLHDLSAFLRTIPNEHAILEPDPIPDLVSQGAVQDVWWSQPDSLYPFLIRADDNPAGFILVAGRPYVPDSLDYLVHEFFLFHAYRGTNVAHESLVQLCDSKPGRWEAHVDLRNTISRRFFRRALATGPFEEAVELEAPSFQMGGEPATLFRFAIAGKGGRQRDPSSRSDPKS